MILINKKISIKIQIWFIFIFNGGLTVEFLRKEFENEIIENIRKIDDVETLKNLLGIIKKVIKKEEGI